MTPEQIRAEIAQDDATLEEIQRVTETYQRDDVTYYDETSDSGTFVVCDGEPASCKRHTIDITGPSPQHIEDELLAFERKARQAKWAWLAMGILIAGYLIWRTVS